MNTRTRCLPCPCGLGSLVSNFFLFSIRVGCCDSRKKMNDFLKNRVFVEESGIVWVDHNCVSVVK